MVEENSRAAEHVIGLTIFLDNPEAIQFGNCIRAVRMERRILILRNLLHLSVELRCRCLVHSASPGQPALTYSLKHAQHAHSVSIGRIFRGIEADLDVALGREIIYLVRAHLRHHLEYAHGVGHVSIMQMEMRTALQMSNPFTEIY